MSIARQTKDGVVVSIVVQPCSSKQELVGIHGDRLRVRLKAAPVDNAANESLIKLFAKTLGVRRDDVALVAGGRSRNKEILVRNAELATVCSALGL